MGHKQMDLEAVKEYIKNCSETTKFYLGSDSERYRKNSKWFADYTVCIVAHIDGCHGCKIFGEVQTAPDYDQRKDRPSMRLMGEVHRISELFQKLQDVLKDRHVEIHLDLNKKKIHGSNIVVAEALGFIKGTCNMTAQLKPNAWAASYAADRLKEVLHLPYATEKPKVRIVA